MKASYLKANRNVYIWTMVAVVLAIAGMRANAQLPANFPGFTVTTCNSNAVAPGSIFISVTDPGSNGAFYMMILTNDATPLWYQAATNDIFDFKPLA